MRITGGGLSGRKLNTPTSRAIRPMRDQVRMALFNILGPHIVKCRFLDLFAGTGSVGLEALSRGAEHAVFVDQLPAALQTLKRNVEALGLEAQSEILAGDVFDAIFQLEHQLPFDVIFVGPPYYQELATKTIQALAQSAILAPEGLVVAEIFRKETLETSYDQLVELDRRLYGDNLLVFYELQIEGEG